jgi:hypothetical protein
MAKPDAFVDKLPSLDIVYPFRLFRNTFAPGERIKYEVSHAYCMYIHTNLVIAFGDISLQFGDTGDEIPFGSKAFLRTSGFRTILITNLTGAPLIISLVVSSDPNMLLNRSAA